MFRFAEKTPRPGTSRPIHTLKRYQLAHLETSCSMKIFGGVLMLAFGVFVLVGVLLFATDTLPPPRGMTVGLGNYIFGIIVAAAAFFTGYSSIKKASRTTSALRGEVLQDPNVIGLYERTMRAWAAGELQDINHAYKKEGNTSYERFVRANAPTEGGALRVFFLQFTPRSDEYLVSIGDTNSGKGWFVLTNQRLIQKDGRDNSYKEIDLRDIKGYETSGTFTKRLVFQLSSGEAKEFSKVEIFPSESVLMTLVERAKRTT